MNNPYTARGPISDSAMFYGRKNELDEINAFLRGNQSVSIIGPHKIGKTSLLWHLMQAESTNKSGIGATNLYTFFDCQEFSSKNQNEILASIATRVGKTVGSSGLEPEPALIEAISNPTWSAFDIALHELNLRELRVVLLLDGFEQLAANPNLDANFYNALRSLPGRRKITFITCSEEPLIDLTYKNNPKKMLSSPFFNIFAQIDLGMLTADESSQLIREPMEAAGIGVNSQLEDFIYQLAGGHPLALQIACTYAWQTPADYPMIESRTMEELDELFQNSWRNLSLAEQDVVRHPDQAGLREESEPSMRVVLRRLTRKCLLVLQDGIFKYPSKAWANFVAAQ